MDSGYILKYYLQDGTLKFITDGNDYIFYKYFLIDTDKLKKADNGSVKMEEHNFNDVVYLEFNPLMK